MTHKFYSAWMLVLPLILLIGGCTELFDLESSDREASHDVPIEGRAGAAIKAKGMRAEDPIVIRIFKREGKLEVWKKPEGSESYQYLTAYDICKYSGKLGPKLATGDHQAPEGFYWVGRAQMNPNSRFHLSFNLGFPNLFDRANGRTGSYLMVHGNCVSAGCYAMTDKRIEEIYALVREAHKGGQKSVQVQAFPFKMSRWNMTRAKGDINEEFWNNLKEGYDAFESTKRPVKVDVCEKRYIFNQKTKVPSASFNSVGKCPELVPTDPPEPKKSELTPVLATEASPKPAPQKDPPKTLATTETLDSGSKDRKLVDGVFVEPAENGDVKLVF